MLPQRIMTVQFGYCIYPENILR